MDDQIACIHNPSSRGYFNIRNNFQNLVDCLAYDADISFNKFPIYSVSTNNFKLFSTDNCFFIYFLNGC